MIWRCAGDFFSFFAEIQNGRHGGTSIFCGRKSEIIHILQSHHPPSGNVQVILLIFKMAPQVDFLNIYDPKNCNLIMTGNDTGLQASCGIN